MLDALAAGPLQASAPAEAVVQLNAFLTTCIRAKTTRCRCTMTRTCRGGATCLLILFCGTLSSAVLGQETPALHRVETPSQWAVTGDAPADYELHTNRTAALSGES